MQENTRPTRFETMQRNVTKAVQVRSSDYASDPRAPLILDLAYALFLDYLQCPPAACNLANMEAPLRFYKGHGGQVLFLACHININQIGLLISVGLFRESGDRFAAYVHEGDRERSSVGHVRFDEPATIEDFCRTATAYITEQAIAMSQRLQ